MPAGVGRGRLILALRDDWRDKPGSAMIRCVKARRASVVGLALTGCLAGCGAHHHSPGAHQHSPGARTTAGRRVPRLTGAHPCRGQPGFTCSTLRVPLDHARQVGGSLALAVGVASAGAAPRGVLLFLTGGPGQPGIPFLTRVRTRLRAEVAGYRLVMFDQRGTGAGALDCPALQAAAGASDLAGVRANVVAACARSIGPARRYYATAETVADIEQLRQALRAGRLTLDGVSYGTFVAERYALTYPAHVARLVLDSVVPQAGADPLYRAALSASGRVLRSVCAAERCGWDPAADVAVVVNRLHVGAMLLDALVADSVAAPDFPGVINAVHLARAGHPSELDALLAGVQRAEAAPARFLSQGLHESALCLELAAPWDPGAPRPGRAAALSAAAVGGPAAARWAVGRPPARGPRRFLRSIAPPQWATASPRAASTGRLRSLRRCRTAHPRQYCPACRSCCCPGSVISPRHLRGLGPRRRWHPMAGCSRYPARATPCSSGLVTRPSAAR